MSEMSVYGKDLHHESLADYESSDEYADQPDTRTIKHLMFPWMVEAPNPAHSDGPNVLKERVAKQGDVVTIEELGTLALEKGERLGSFYTDAELKNPATPAQLPAGATEESASTSSEWGVPELVQYIETNKPNVDDTVALAQGDPEAAKRVLDAEAEATGGDPRAGVTKGLAAVIGDAS
jgi:hypothetical protein